MRQPVFATVFLVGAFGAAIASCSTDALTHGDCPGAPTDLKANVVAPYWNGLVELDYKVPDGAPGNVEVQAFDSYLKIWKPTGLGSGLSQKDDGDYVSILSIPVTKTNEALDQKMRVRTTLEGCAPSDWAESKAFKVTNPLAGSTWVSHFAPEDVAGEIEISGIDGALGPYHLDPTSVTHTVHFGAQNDVEEEVVFTIQSDHSGDDYDNCQFDVHFAGDYALSSDLYTVRVGSRHLTADPANGSSCTHPSVDSMEIRQSGASLEEENWYLGNVDYSPLLASPAGAARWMGLSGTIDGVINLLSVPGGDSVASGVDLSTGDYLKQ